MRATLSTHATAVRRAIVLAAVACAWLVLGAPAGSAAPKGLDGTWECCGAGGAAAQVFEIEGGAGVARLPGGQVFAAIKASGGTPGGSVTIVTTYNDFAPGYVATFVGTLSQDGGTITGSWTSNRGQEGTFTATRSVPEHTVSGSVVEQVCSATSCSRKGLAGVTVRATGGPQGPEETTTAADGTYSLELREGSWRLTPSLGDRRFERLLANGDGNGEAFAPLTLKADVDGIDFGTCGAPTGAARTLAAAPLCKPDLVVEGIELTQGIQEPELQDLTSGQGGVGQPAIAYEGVPLVAGRTTVVRVFVGARLDPALAAGTPKPSPEGVAGVPVRIRVLQGGRAIADRTVKIGSVAPWPVLPGARMNRTNSVAELVVPGATVAAGRLEVDVRVNEAAAGGKRPVAECADKACERNDEVGVAATLVRTSAPDVQILRVQDQSGDLYGVIAAAPERAGALLFEGVAERWPLPNGAPVGTLWRGAPIDLTQAIVRSGEASGRIVRCESRPECGTVLVDRIVATLKAWWVLSGRPAGHFVAPISRTLTTRVTPTTTSTVNGATHPRLPLTWSVYSGLVPLHETMHQFDIGHADTACGGGAGGQTVDPRWPPGRGVIRGYGVDLGSDLSAIRRLVGPPDAFYDPMSYCKAQDGSDVWISTINWRALVAAFSSGTAPRTTRLPAGASGGLSVSALVPPDAPAEILAVVPTDEATSAPAAAPTHVLVARDVAGAEVGRVPVSAEAGHSGAAVVDAVVPLAASVELQALDGTVLASRGQAATPPEPRIAAPRAGARVAAGKGLEVRWAVTGGEGAELLAAVDLSIDGGRTWRTLAAAVGGDRVAIPAAALTRSTSARLRVRVTDGFVEREAVVTGLRLGGVPPRVRIESPLGAKGTLVAGTRAVLRGSALDDADRALAGRRLRWLEGRRVLGTGPTLSLARLKPGTHRIVLVATDAAGRSARATATVRVTKAPRR